MALTKTHFPEATAVLGPAQSLRTYQLQPGTSDYPTGGYVITAASVGFAFLFGAWIAAQKYGTSLYYPVFCLPSGSFASTPLQATSIYLAVYQSAGSAAPPVEIANGTDLSAYTFIGTFLGY